MPTRAYRALPHEQIDAYFEAAQRDARKLIRSRMQTMEVREFLDEAQEAMGEERWDEAKSLIRVVLAGTPDNGFAQFLIAVCEFRS